MSSHIWNLMTSVCAWIKFPHRTLLSSTYSNEYFDKAQLIAKGLYRSNSMNNAFTRCAKAPDCVRVAFLYDALNPRYICVPTRVRGFY